MAKASEYFEREVDQTVKTLTTAMEPFIMIVLGYWGGLPNLSRNYPNLFAYFQHSIGL